MKSTAHAWVALMALERLKGFQKTEVFKRTYLGENHPNFYIGDDFDAYFKKQAEQFTNYFDNHKDAFVKGAWFPDSVISDNLTGGHTFKLKEPNNKKELAEADIISNRLPSHLSSIKALGVKEGRFKEKIYRKEGYVLPDRCEALSHAIRDMVIIQKDEPKGSDILFNDDQITLYFLMLSHYIADAHVPPHSDDRDFYGPSTIHPDMEKYWDEEIEKYYEFDKKRGVFDYDLGGAPELKKDDKIQEQFKDSILYKAIEELSSRKWVVSKTNGKLNTEILGEGNKKIYDYIKAVCFSSYLISTDFIPKTMPEKEYKKLKILKEPEYKEKLDLLSVHVLADAIDSIALIWLLTWDRYKALKDGIKEKTGEIKEEGFIK